MKHHLTHAIGKLRLCLGVGFGSILILFITLILLTNPTNAHAQAYNYCPSGEHLNTQTGQCESDSLQSWWNGLSDGSKTFIIIVGIVIGVVILSRLSGSSTSTPKTSPPPTPKASSPPAQPPLQDERLRQLDLCFVMDATGSMRKYTESTRRDLKAFAQKISTHPTRPRMSYALVIYRDHPDSRDHSYSGKSLVTECHQFSDNLNDLQRALDNTQIHGGSDDGPEAVADGLYDACYKLRWRENSHKVIILVGDAPPHGKGSKSDNYHSGCPCGNNPDTIARDAHARGISTFCLGIGDNMIMKRSFEQIANIGGGKFVSIGSADKLIDQASGIMNTELDKVHIDGIVLAACRPGATSQSIATTTGLDNRVVGESINRLRHKKLIS